MGASTILTEQWREMEQLKRSPVLVSPQTATVSHY